MVTQPQQYSIVIKKSTNTMMKKLSLFVLIGLSLALSSWRDSNPILTIDGGQIVGVPTATKGVIAYKGIPFAAPPVGVLRWKEPQPVISWKGVRKADAYGAAAMQVTWDPQMREIFERNLIKIDDSLKSSRQSLIEHPNDADHQQMLMTLYNEKLQLLQDYDRLK